jgi:hypothetical protein
MFPGIPLTITLIDIRPTFLDFNGFAFDFIYSKHSISKFINIKIESKGMGCNFE